METTLCPPARPDTSLRLYDPTPRQLEVLKAVDDYTRAHDYPPTLRDLSRMVDAVLPTVSLWIVHLECSGLVTRRRGAARSAVITAKGRLLLDGWRPGALPGLDPLVLAIDTECAGEMRCPRCRRVGLLFSPWHRPATVEDGLPSDALHGGVFSCLFSSCQFSEVA